MRKRTVVVLSVLTVMVIGGIGTGTVVLVRHEPAFYRRAEIEPGAARADWSKEYQGLLFKLYNNITQGAGPQGTSPWSVQISQDQLNSFFQEGFLKWGDAGTFERQGISAPRVAFEPKRILLGFRYGQKPWQTIISFNLHVWLVPKEVNLVAVEVEGRHAGALPISAQSILDIITEQARRQNLEITWWRHNGNRVALVRFQSDKAHPTFQLRGLNIEAGKLTISGQCLEPGQQAVTALQ